MTLNKNINYSKMNYVHLKQCGHEYIISHFQIATISNIVVLVLNSNSVHHHFPANRSIVVLRIIDRKHGSRSLITLILILVIIICT